MKKIALAIALAAASLGTAQAQVVTPDRAPAVKQTRFLLGGGFTFGGDKLATAKFADGSSIDIRAGSIIALNAGVDHRVGEAFSVQGTVGYHVDDASGKNGGIRFQRYPIELLGYYHVAPHWRIGGGVRYVSNPKLVSTGTAYFGNYEFENTVSGVVEAEYLLGAHWGFKVRYVNESFKSKLNGFKVRGNHTGLLANFYF